MREPEYEELQAENAEKKVISMIKEGFRDRKRTTGFATMKTAFFLL